MRLIYLLKSRFSRKTYYVFGVLLVFAFSKIVLAAPLYLPGQTLDPACLPTAVDCTVSVSSLGASATAGYFIASSTTNSLFPNLVSTTSTSTNATTTSFAISGILSSLLKTNALGSVIPATLTSAELLSIVTDETGSGSVVFGTSPTITGLLSLSNASSSLFSNTGTAYFGGTATSTFNSAGVLTLISALGVSSGGTGVATFGQGWLHSAGGANALTSSTSPTVNYLTATSTTATSTFAGGFAVETSGLVYDYFSNNVGIGTASPASRLDITNSATSSAIITLRDVVGGASMEFRAGTSTLQNTFIGVNSGRANTTGYSNTALGYQALLSNTTATNNTAYGALSLLGNSSGSSNTAYGALSLLGNSSGYALTALGMSALLSNTTGASSTAVGHSAGYSNTTGSQNTFLGMNSGYTDGVVTTPNNLINATAIGYNAQVLQSNAFILGGTGAFAVNVGIGTTSPYARLSVVGQIVGSYFTATTTTASTFPYASTTALTVSGTGGLQLASGLTGPLQAQAGLVSATTSIGVVYGGTGLTSAPTYGQLLIGNASSGYTLSATSTLGILISDTTGTLTVARGGTGQTSFGQGWLHSDGTTLTSSTSPTVNYLTATSTTATSTFAGGFAVETSGLVYDYSTNNVGIGTASPASRLDITNSATSSAIITLRDVIGGVSLELRAGTSTLRNIFIGAGAGNANTTGAFNTASGYEALRVNTTGLSNTSIGHQSMWANTSGYWNTAVGVHALIGNTTGYQNTASGVGALYSNTTGTSSTGVGYQAGYANTVGYQNTFIGENAGNTDGTTATLNNLFNATAIGYSAQVRQSSSLVLGGTGLYAVNVGIGTTTPLYRLDVSGFINTDQYSGYKQAGNTILYASTTNFSTLVGNGAGAAVRSDGNYNTALGYRALYTATSSDGNTAIGDTALFSNTTGYSNTGVGEAVLFSNTTGYQNTAVGDSSLSSNITGTSTTAIGYQSGYANTVGYQNTFIGTDAGHTDGTTATLNNLFNATAIGYSAQVRQSSSLVLGGTGLYAVNVGIGTTTPLYRLDVSGFINTDQYSGYKQAGNTILYASTTNFSTLGGIGAGAALLSDGLSNTAFGHQALFIATSTDYNTAIGYRALYANIEGGQNNTAVGFESLRFNTTGRDNTALGFSAMYANTTGGGNLALGSDALGANTTGTSTVAIGASSGGRNITGYQNTFLGYNAGASLVTPTNIYNATAIGSNSNVSASNSLILGGVEANAVNVGIGTTTPFAKLSIQDTYGSQTALFSIASTTAALGTATSSVFTVLASGNVGIGTSTPQQRLHVAQTATGVVARFTNGTGYCDINPTTTALVCTSDATLKKDVETIENGLDSIVALRGVNFRWNSENSTSTTHIGFIAQEVEKVLPSLVATDESSGKKSVNYIGFTPVLIEAIKELANRVANLEARIAQGISTGATSIKNFVVETLTAKKVVTESIEMKDSVTGETYCLKIANGEWDKVKGACADISSNTQTPPVVSADTVTVNTEVPADTTPIETTGVPPDSGTVVAPVVEAVTQI